MSPQNIEWDLLAAKDVQLEIKFRLSATKFLFHPLQPSQNALGVGAVADPSEMESKKPNVAMFSELELER